MVQDPQQILVQQHQYYQPCDATVGDEVDLATITNSYTNTSCHQHYQQQHQSHLYNDINRLEVGALGSALSLSTQPLVASVAPDLVGAVQPGSLSVWPSTNDDYLSSIWDSGDP